MALYTITTKFCGVTEQTVTRQTRPSAALAYEKAVRAMVTSYAALDTLYGDTKIRSARFAHFADKVILELHDTKVIFEKLS